MRKPILAGDSRNEVRTIIRAKNLFAGMKYPLLWSLVTLSFGLASVTSLQADLIFNHSGPGDAFDNMDSWALSYNHYIHHADEDYVFQFVVSDDYSLGSISFTAGVDFGCNEFDVWLLNDAGNTPGYVLESFNFNGAISDHGSVIAGTSVLQPLLNSVEQYRMTASASGALGTQANWCWNPIEDMGLINGWVDMGYWYTFTNTWERFPYPAP